MNRQRSIETLTLDSGSLRDFGDPPRQCEVPLSQPQNSTFGLVFECRLETFGGKLRVLPKPPHNRLVGRDTGFAFHGVPPLLNCNL